MSSMHDAVRRMVAATEARHAAHADTVTSGVQDRPEGQPPAGRHAPAGPAFPLPAQDRTGDGSDPQSN